MHFAPASTSNFTTGAVLVARSWVAAQSGLPNPVTYPSTSNLFNHDNTFDNFHVHSNYTNSSEKETASLSTHQQSHNQLSSLISKRSDWTAPCDFRATGKVKCSSTTFQAPSHACLERFIRSHSKKYVRHQKALNIETLHSRLYLFILPTFEKHCLHVFHGKREA